MTAEAPRPMIRPGLVVLAGVAWVLVVIGWTLSARLWFAEQMYREVTARVDDVRLHVGQHDRLTRQCSTGRPHTVVTTYSYEVDGQRYVSSAYDRRFDSEIFCSKASAETRVAELERERTLTVFYDPDDPGYAVQRTQERSEVIVVYILLAVIAYVLYRFYRRQQRLQRAYDAATRANLEA